MLTTPIYYANAEPHIGTLYTTLAVDYVSRLINRPYTTGLDEHGKKIAQTAEKNSLTPQEHVDLMADKFERIFYRFDCHPYRFIRTTDPDHELAVIDQ
ncbi:MAG: class I tRNA ligase family protein, partial [Candidimonas sp.]